MGLPYIISILEGDHAACLPISLRTHFGPSISSFSKFRPLIDRHCAQSAFIGKKFTSVRVWRSFGTFCRTGPTHVTRPPSPLTHSLSPPPSSHAPSFHLINYIPQHKIPASSPRPAPDPSFRRFSHRFSLCLCLPFLLPLCSTGNRFMRRAEQKTGLQS